PQPVIATHRAVTHHAPQRRHDQRLRFAVAEPVGVERAEFRLADRRRAAGQRIANRPRYGNVLCACRAEICETKRGEQNEKEYSFHKSNGARSTSPPSIPVSLCFSTFVPPSPPHRAA